MARNKRQQCATLAEVSWPAKRAMNESAMTSCFVRYESSSGVFWDALTRGPGMY